jgi:hypothetical protein
MNSDPCAILGTRKTPSTKLNPEVTINKIMARLRPTNKWLLKAARVISCPAPILQIPYLQPGMKKYLPVLPVFQDKLPARERRAGWMCVNSIDCALP